MQTLSALKTRPPRLPPGLVRRPALDAALTAATARPVTLVSAGPGSGKTLTVAEWAGSGTLRLPIGWLSLDASDDDVPSFWSNLIAALIASGGVPEDNALREFIPAAEFGAAEVLEVRARLTELPSPVVLVLDDFHEISNAAVVESFGELVDHLPASLRLVLLSRSDPPLRLHRLRIAGQLTEIRSSELAFTEKETAELFGAAGFDLRAGQVTTLRNRTEGWSAGLRLAAMSLDPADVQAGIDRFSGSERSVADYLVGEVIRRLSPADRDFLLATSVVDRVSGPLANRLTGRSDGQQLLERFVRNNAFVVGLGGRYEWFRFHPLLRELMRYRLRLDNPQLVPQLHRRAAEWMTEHSDPIGAIVHWILAGDEQEAGGTMLQVLPKMLTAEGPALAAAIRPMAKSAAAAPSLITLLASASWHFHRHEFAAMSRDAMEAKDFLEQAPGDVRPSAQVVISLFEMVAARNNADTATVADLARRVIDLVDSTSRSMLPARRAYRAIGRVNLAGAHLWNGNHAQAQELLDHAAAESLEAGLPLTHLNAIGHLALLDALHGWCRDGDRRAKQAIQIAERRGWLSEPQALAALLTHALVELARQHPRSANDFVQRGLAGSRGGTDRTLRLAFGIAAVQVAVARGDIAGALTADSLVTEGLARTPAAPHLLLRWAAIAGAEALLLVGRPDDALARVSAPADRPGLASAWERVCLARIRLALGESDAAEALITPLLRSVDTPRESAVTAWVLHAVAATRDHRDSAALTALTSAIDLAQPEGIRRPFLQPGGAPPELLTRYRDLGGRHDAFAADLLAQLHPQPVMEPGLPIVEHLTERELSVLGYLPTMLKAGEIAQSLFVSVNTVKAHQRSIYRKLGAANRRQAVERARTLRLLQMPPTTAGRWENTRD